MVFKNFSRKIDNLQNYHIEDDDLTYGVIDEQTKLPNLTYGRKILGKILQQPKNRPFALLAIKINGFATINTNLGFDIGDQAIYQISQILKELLKGKGVLYRLYGNEWEAIILPARSEKYITNLAQQIIKKIQEPLKIHHFILHLDATIGMNIIKSDDECTSDTVLQQTHTALRKAEALGSGNYQLYSSEMSIETHQSFQLETDLYQALENHELFIEYQPQVDIKTQRVTCAEALLCWNHPVWGNVSPYQMILIAEKRDCIHEKVTRFVLDTVCKQMKKWQRKGVTKPKISIKFSPKIFLYPAFADWIITSLKKYKISAKCLEIEILESAFLHNFEIAKEQIDQLHKMGITFCLGDVGTRHSTIAYLKKLPIQKIKIGRPFMDNLDKSNQDRVIVRSIIDIGKQLGIKVCAEGVETKEQLQILREFKCDEVQGSYFCPTLSGDEVMQRLKVKRVLFSKRLDNDQENRRKYFRVQLPLPLSTQMTILTFRNQRVSLGSAEVLVIDLSPGGLRFISHLRLPTEEKIIYRFSSELNQTSFQASGEIVWSTEIHPGIYEYGIEFTISEIERNDIVQLLFQITPKLRDNPYSIDGNFISQDPIVYIKKNFID